MFANFSADEKVNLNSKEILSFYKQIDSLKLAELKDRKPKTFFFNPNYVTDFKANQIGMSLNEIDRLFKYRKAGKFINSDEEFQRITKVSDSLLNKISPLFRYPKSLEKKKYNYKNKKKLAVTKITTNDINKATEEDFRTINGVGEILSKRIIKFRTRLKGFSFEDQLLEVWGLDKLIVEKILSTFKIIEKPAIKKENINTTSFKQLLKNPYIDYKLCKMIFDYRDEVAELQNILELKKIKNFPVGKYDRIVLYLEAK